MKAVLSLAIRFAKALHILVGQLPLSLTHSGWDKMAPISQTTFWSAFSWIEIYKFKFKFHWILFTGVQITIFQHCSDNGLVSARWQAIIWTNDGPDWWCIYTLLGLNELSWRYFSWSKQLFSGYGDTDILNLKHKLLTNGSTAFK